MRVVPVVMIAAGLVLIWAAVTDRNPLEAIKAVLSGKEIPEPGSMKKSLGELLFEELPDQLIPGSDTDGGEIIQA